MTQSDNLEPNSANHKLQWLQHLQMTNEQIALVKRYRCLVGIDGFGFWQWNYANQSFHCHGQLYFDAGYTTEDIESLENATEVRGYIHPDDLDRSIVIVRHHVQRQSPIHFTFRLLRKSGDYLWVTTIGSSIRDEHGRIATIVGVVFDATNLRASQEALREAELRLQRIMSASNDGIWEWKANNPQVEFSERVLQHLGFEHVNELVDGNESLISAWIKRIHPSDQRKFKVKLKSALKHRKFLDVDYRIADKNNVYRWVRTRANARFNAQGRPIVISGTNIDITDIKLAQSKLSAARDQAEQANQSKSKFLSGMSRHLRTPMNAILGYAQLFEYDHNLTQQQRDNMREVRKAGEHLIQLIDDVLDLSKIESGNITLTNEPTLVSDIVRDCINLSHPQANKYGVSITSEIDETEALYADCDRVRLKQILLNLISNGIKYNRPSGWVNIKVFILDENELCISVEDNGFGIAEEEKGKLFQPFNRLGAEKTTIEGSGVGLVITKNLVEMMHGAISFYTQEGVGSCFEIHLKRCDDLSEVAPETIGKILKEQRSIQLNIASTKTVLYIEDNTANLRLMEKFIEHIDNVELEVATDPLLGVYKARRLQPNLILLDLEIPGLNAPEIIEILKSDSATATIPVVALSSNREEGKNFSKRNQYAGKKIRPELMSEFPLEDKSIPSLLDHSASNFAGSDFYSYLVKPWNIDQIVSLLESVFVEPNAEGSVAQLDLPLQGE
ncbi:hypothetical protein MAH1_15900 [Sessilibacter sp. MAH1]